MRCFLLKLLPPRASFLGDMTPAEAQLMAGHLDYWRGLMGRGHAVAFGPVEDPAGAYGLGLVELPDGVEPDSIAAADPVILAAAGFRYEIHPMPRAIVRGSPAVAANALSVDEQMERFAKELKENDWGHQPC